jgi:enoyl-CoA hydratase/carnithine racemase
MLVHCVCVCVCVCVCAVYRLTPGISGVVMAAGIAPGRTGSESLLRELAYTGRDFSSEEAARHGFVSRVFAERETMCEHALATAQQIAANSPCDCWPPAP